MKNRKLFLIMVLSLCFIDFVSLLAQNNLKLKLDKGTHLYYKYQYDDEHPLFNLWIKADYQPSYLYSASFSNYLASGEKVKKFGGNFGFLLTVGNFGLDLNRFGADVNDINYLKGYSGIFNYYQSFSNDKDNFLSYIQPYFGIGYQSSTANPLLLDMDNYGMTKYNSLIWSVGLTFKSSMGGFHAGYKQCFDTKNPNSFNMWSIGLMYSLTEIGKTIKEQL